MTAAEALFVDYMGGLGARWGLPEGACRAHALLYLVGRPMTAEDMAEVAGPAGAEVALGFLADYRMATEGPNGWSTGDDPWAMLMSGLAERRRREVEPALTTLRQCQELAAAEGPAGRPAAIRIGRLLALAEDLAAIDAQAGRIPAGLLKGLVGFSSRAARLADRVFNRRREP